MRTRERASSTTTIAPDSIASAWSLKAAKTISLRFFGVTSCARTWRTLGPDALVKRENRSEVQIVSENDVTVLTSPFDNLGVGRARIADGSPVHGFKRHFLKNVYPTRREVDVNDDLQFSWSGTSISSARQAANASASWTSSFSRYG